MRFVRVAGDHVWVVPACAEFASAGGQGSRGWTYFGSASGIWDPPPHGQQHWTGPSPGIRHGNVAEDHRHASLHVLGQTCGRALSSLAAFRLLSEHLRSRGASQPNKMSAVGGFCQMGKYWGFSMTLHRQFLKHRWKVDPRLMEMNSNPLFAQNSQLVSLLHGTSWWIRKFLFQHPWMPVRVFPK